MVYGDGDGVVFQRFTSALDVVAHELTHPWRHPVHGAARLSGSVWRAERVDVRCFRLRGQAMGAGTERH
jgi:hypothetical protein